MGGIRWLVLLAACLLWGCEPTGTERVDAAKAVVSNYIHAVSGEDPQRGWLMLDAEAKQVLFGDDSDAYIAEANMADWAGFSFEIVDTRIEDAFVVVEVRVIHGIMPSFLLARKSDLAIVTGNGGLYSLVVRFGTFGAGSIAVMGG